MLSIAPVVFLSLLETFQCYKTNLKKKVSTISNFKEGFLDRYVFFFIFHFFSKFDKEKKEGERERKIRIDLNLKQKNSFKMKLISN